MHYLLYRHLQASRIISFWNISAFIIEALPNVDVDPFGDHELKPHKK